MLLAQVTQHHALRVQPPDQLHGDADLGASELVARAGGLSAALSPLEIVLDMPDSEGAQENAILAFGHPVDLALDETLEGGALMANGQNAGSYKGRPQVGGALAAFDGVQRLVGQLDLPAGELGHRLVAGTDRHPVEHRPWLGPVAQRGQVGLKLCDGPLVGARGQRLQTFGEDAARATPVGVVLLLGSARATHLNDRLAGTALTDPRIADTRSPRASTPWAVQARLQPAGATRRALAPKRGTTHQALLLAADHAATPRPQACTGAGLTDRRGAVCVMARPGALAQRADRSRRRPAG
ncbi:MAG: hypothetical protein MSC31_12970 [Solirubrobacteraceae bacterium MAG38_C4-C5]|nr:hypothetical protein [Candidatus Siliceabacter maunaloa]